VADETHAIPVVVDLLRYVLLEGWIVALDALLMQRHIAQQNVAAGGDDVIVVHENRPQITCHPLCGWFEDTPLKGGTIVDSPLRGHHVCGLLQKTL
jgi:hypothetical protein